MMSMIKKSLKIFGLAVFLVSSNASATDISVGGSSVSINDRADSGQGGTSANGYLYNINKMNVKWSSNNTITVDVFTNFARKNGFENNYHDALGGNNNNNNNIIFGDLLIGANKGSDSGYNYAFSLGDFMNSSATRFNWNNLSNETAGGLYAINSTESAGQYHGYKKNGRIKHKGAVFGNTTGLEQNANSSFWSVSGGANTGKISFSFNVGGIDAFKNATSLSLSWAMSCFNDAVHDTFAVNRGNKPAVVPEPSTIILMLLALVGITYRQRTKRDSFSA
ncbi:PEP-CTERM sorting domain-containing protein [Cognaticolwellia mytili]|uniref:PEP-CTERM sorting domain-containing protein n=1 Tax=Cognaticolwellia mytili TaxID=1888913 RepID=UPI001301DA4C|nr:PEP-CTERM sorting domain-containing protein [Cognaticolwellia mytili]